MALNSRDNSGSQFCNLYGRYEPFSDAVIAQLYPTHAAYVAAAKASNAANLKAGFIVAADAKVSDERAEQSIFGYGYPCAAACLAGQDLVDSTYFFLGLNPKRNAFGARMAAIVRTIAAGDKVAAEAIFRASTSVIDKIADKDIVHKNTAARHKSRLSRQIKALAA